jgi:hypothetical protein
MYCKNCKYFKAGDCTHPKAISSISLHTGMRVYKKAIDMRKNFKDSCGHTGRYYLDKESIHQPTVDHNVYCSSCAYCKLDTTWYSYTSQLEYAHCTHAIKYMDPVTGEPVYHETRKMRSAEPHDINTMYLCGPQGVFYEPQSSNPYKDEISKKYGEISKAMKHIAIQIFLLALSVLAFIFKTMFSS